MFIQSYCYSRCSFSFHDDIKEHLMHFGMVLFIVVKMFTSQFELILLLIVTYPHQHLQSLQLQLSQRKLFQRYNDNRLPPLHISLYISRIVNDSFNKDLILLWTQLCLHLVQCTQFVCIVDIDEVRFYVVRNCLVVLWLPKFGLTSSTLQKVFWGTQ